MSGTTTETMRESRPKSAQQDKHLEKITPSLDSENKSRPSSAASAVSRTYLKDAAEHLLDWMNKMKGQEISPANVNAVCNIAQQVANIVKVNIEIKRSGL